MVFSIAKDYNNYYQKDMDLLIYVLEKNAEYMTDNQKNKLYNCKEIKVKYIDTLNQKNMTIKSSDFVYFT